VAAMEFLRSLGERHERLKKKIHSTRIPLSKNGQRFMAAVYFSIPVISGYYIMQWAQSRADVNFLKEVRGGSVRCGMASVSYACVCVCVCWLGR
jgi:hypothetical protein